MWQAGAEALLAGAAYLAGRIFEKGLIDLATCLSGGSICAVGDFRLVMILKPLSSGRFAVLDTFVRSPLCLMLAAFIATIL